MADENTPPVETQIGNDLSKPENSNTDTIPTSPSNSKENETPSTPPQSIHDGAPPLDPVTGGISDAIEDQGRQAKELKLTEDDCPYGEGDNRDKWLAGFHTAESE